MDTGFKNPIKDQGKEVPYDKRSGCFISRGDSYGVGHKNPIGKTESSKSYGVPVGRVNTLHIYEEK